MRKTFASLPGWFRQQHYRSPKTDADLVSVEEVSKPQFQENGINIFHLPDDVLVGIFSNLLDLVEFPNLALVCRLWCQLSDDQLLWKQRWFKRWNISILCRESVFGAGTLTLFPTFSMRGVWRSETSFSAYDWKKICMEHHLAEQESPSFTRPPFNGYGISNARIEEGPNPVYFSPIVANVKLTSGRWVYEVEIKKFSVRKYYKRQPKRALDQLAQLMDETADDDMSDDEEEELAREYMRRAKRSSASDGEEVDSEYEDDDVFVEDEDNREPKGLSTEEEEEEESQRDLYSGSLIAQIGFVTMRFYSPQLDMYGVGDDRHSWGYDGCRRFLFYGGIVRRRGAASQVHRLRFAPDTRWKIGDVVGIAIDIEDDETRLEYFLNGKSLGLAPCEIRTQYHQGGFFPALSRSRSGDKAQYVFRFGSESSGGKLKYEYPRYQPIGCDALDKLAASRPAKQASSTMSSSIRGAVRKSIRVSPLVPISTQFATHSFAVSVVADAEEITFLSWDEGVVRARVEFVRNSIHPTWSLVFGYNSRQHTRVIRYLKWDGTPWSARIVYDSATGKHTLCHWPAGDQDKKDFAMESDTSTGSDSEGDDVEANEEGDNPKRKQTKLTRISDNTEDLMMDVANRSYVAPAGSYLDPALTYRGSSNSKCTACPVDFETHPTGGFSRESGWIPAALRRF
jgi:hypothetical protein